MASPRDLDWVKIRDANYGTLHPAGTITTAIENATAEIGRQIVVLLEGVYQDAAKSQPHGLHMEGKLAGLDLAQQLIKLWTGKARPDGS